METLDLFGGGGGTATAERPKAAPRPDPSPAPAPAPAPARAEQPHKRKGYPPEALQHMLTDLFRKNPGMPREVRADAQARARTAYDADPVDTEALWALVEGLRAAWEPSWAGRTATGERLEDAERRESRRAVSSSPAAPLEVSADTPREDAPSVQERPTSVHAEPSPVQSVVPSVQSTSVPPRPPANRLERAAGGDLGALAQLRRCTVCGEGLIPAPPAPRVCDRCDAVGLLPSYRDTPRDFLRWIDMRNRALRFEAGLTRQQLFAQLVHGAFWGRTMRAGDQQLLVRATTPAGEVYRFALDEYARWLDAGSPDLLWEITR